MTEYKLDHMFDPDIVALAGASKSPYKWGSTILRHIVKGGYEGEIYPINPEADEILDLNAYPSVLDTPETPDLTLIATPSQAVPSVLEDCIDRGVETAVIITAGFGEAGEEGRETEKELVEMAREGGIRFAGPNCMGIFSSRADLHALMPPVRPLHGNVSFISQSGNLGVQMLDRGVHVGLGFDMFVSSGNEADLTCSDYLEYFRKKYSTDVNLAYIESIKNGRKFLDTAKRTSDEKPIVVFKSGETEAGKSAAQSHTGSMAGSKEVYDGIFRQTGAVKAGFTENMLYFGLGFNQSIPENDEVAILTRGGGWGVVAADACNKRGISVPHPPREIIEELDELLPPYWSGGNPIDTVAVQNIYIQHDIIDALKEWDVGGVIILGGLGGHFIDVAMDNGLSEEDARQYCLEHSEKIVELSEEKTVFTVAFRPYDKSEPAEYLRENGVPVYYDPQTAVLSYSKLLEYKDYLES